MRLQFIVAATVFELAFSLVWCEPRFATAEEQREQTDQHSTTVFPINIKPNKGRSLEFRTSVATVIGALLERSNLKHVELAEREFTPPDTNNTEEIAKAFAQHVDKNSIQTNYALFGQFVGTPRTGVKAIVTIVVDRSGKVVLAERDTPETFAKYSHMSPKNPMTCSIFVARRVGNLWKLPDPFRFGAPTDGKMTALLNKHSKIPPKTEIAAMQKRLAVMKQGLAERQVTVYPIHLSKGKSPGCTEQLVEAINKRGLFKAVAGKADPNLKIAGSHNQQRVLWGTARAFQKFVKTNPPETDYALYVAYGVCGADIKTPPGMQREATGIHLILCNREGDWVMVDFQNSHQSDFKKIEPKTCEDCNTLAIMRLVARLGQ